MVRMAMVLLSRIFESNHDVIMFIKNNKLKLVRILNDELVFDVGPKNNLPSDFIKEFCAKDFIVDGIEFHVNVYQYKLIHYTYNGFDMYKAIFDNPVTNKRKFNSKTCLYTWQLNKMYNGEELTEKDKVQFINGKIVPFTDEIKILND
jgi:hypothetical protein